MTPTERQTLLDTGLTHELWEHRVYCKHCGCQVLGISGGPAPSDLHAVCPVRLAKVLRSTK